MKATPFLIEIEGVDGSGKTTAMRTIAECLDELKVKYLLTREAGNPNIPVCGQLREIALNPKHGLGHEAMECIFAAQKLLNYDWFKTLDYEKVEVVVSDRGFCSHKAYGLASLPRKQIEALFDVVCERANNLEANVIYLRVDPTIAAKRIKIRAGSTDNVEMLGIAHQEKVAANYENLLRNYPHQVWVIDANQTEDLVAKQLRDLVQQIVIDRIGSNP